MEGLKERATCPKCLQLYQSYNSRLLPCLHTFCAECLRKLPVSVQVSTASNETQAVFTHEGTQPGNSYPREPGSGCDSNNTDSNSSEAAICQYIECPKCKKQCLLPEDGVDGFQRSLITTDLASLYVNLENYGRESGPTCFHCKDSSDPKSVAVAYCYKCHYFICEDSLTMHKLWKEYESHEVVSLEDLKKESTKDEEKAEEATSSGGLDLVQKLIKTREDSTGSFSIPSFLKQPSKIHHVSCHLHSDVKLKFYCPVCREVLCHDCIISAHRNHPTVSITIKELEDNVSEMNSIATALSDTSQSLNHMAKKTAEEKDSLKVHVAEVRDLVSSVFSKLEQKLKTRKEALLTQLGELEKEPLQRLEAREHEINKIQHQVAESKEYIEENLSHSGPTAMLSVERTITENHSTLCSELDKIPDLKKSPRYRFLSDNQLLDLVSSFGEIQTMPSGESVSVGHRYSNPCELPASSLGADKLSLCSRLSSVYQTSEFERSSEFASSSDTPSVSSLSIEASLINVRVPRVQGDAIRSIEGFRHPSGLTSANFLMLCEFGSDHHVTVMTHQGVTVRKIGEKGELDGQFWYPQCVTVDSMERMFVTDTNYRIQVFDSSGNWLKSVGTKGKGKLQFKDPVGIAIGTNRHVFVCERENNRIQVLNSDLSHYKFIGRRGKGQCEFNQPTDIAIDSLGLLYVVDSWNHRIQVLTQEGSFVRMIGSRGKNSGQLLSPSHVCVDPDGFLYVSETRNNRISMFTVRGEFVKSFGEKGQGLGQLSAPRGLAIDLNKVLYVSDFGNDRIQVFK